MSVKPKKYSAQEKAKIALEALKGNLTQNEITKRYGVHSTQINRWKQQLKSGAIEIFAERCKRVDKDKDELIDDLYKQIGQLTVERDWLKKKSELFN